MGDIKLQHTIFSFIFHPLLVQAIEMLLNSLVCYEILKR